MEALSLIVCFGLLVIAMVVAHREGLGYPWRVWAVLVPPVVLAYAGIRRLRRAWLGRVT